MVAFTNGKSQNKHHSSTILTIGTCGCCFLKSSNSSPSNLQFRAVASAEAPRAQEDTDKGNEVSRLADATP